MVEIFDRAIFDAAIFDMFPASSGAPHLQLENGGGLRLEAGGYVLIEGSAPPVSASSGGVVRKRKRSAIEGSMNLPIVDPLPQKNYALQNAALMVVLH